MTAEVLLERSSAQWLERLDREGVPCAPVLQRHEVLEHEQIRVNEMIEEHEHPVAGLLRQPRPAARFDKTPAQMLRHAPTLGQHNDELIEELGFDLTQLRSTGAIPDGGAAEA
jgi:crotonobetainyl-CoA:carnitine CoA-transferase CaiB-like acyl-CoA transferase